MSVQSESGIYYTIKGEEIFLHEKISEKMFIVSYCEEIVNFDGEVEYFAQEERVVLDKIYKTPPVEVLAPEVKEQEEKIESLRKEIRDLEIKALRLSKQNIKQEELIIDRSEFMTAKKITYFAVGMPYPKTIELLDDGRPLRSDFRVSFDVNLWSGEERAWAYQSINGMSVRVDMKFGFMFDIPEDEIKEISKSRSAKMLKDREIHGRRWIIGKSAGIKDDYLAPEVIKHFKEELEMEEQRNRELALKKIESLKAKHGID